MEDKPTSKTRKKKDMLALQDLGVELVELNDEQLASMRLPELLLEAVQEARRLTRHEARRRQMQYIGRVMRGIDAAPIRDRLDAWKGQGREHTAQLHALERWRDELLAGDPALARFLTQYPGADSRALRALIRNARREQKEILPPKNFRELFRVLRQAVAQQSQSGESDSQGLIESGHAKHP